MAERVAAGEMAATTATTYARGAARFLSWLGDQPTQAVGPAAIRAWKADLLADGRKPGTVNTFLAGVRAFFSWATAERRLAYNPAAAVKGSGNRKGTGHKREALADLEVLRVLAQPTATTPQGKRDRALLYLLAYTGLRTCEVQRATVGDLHANGRLCLSVQGKGHLDADDKVYLVNGDLTDAVYAWLAVHPRGSVPAAPLFCGLGNRNTGLALDLRTIRRIVKAYYVAAGVRDVRKTTHSLRHSMVSNLIRHGAAPTAI